MQQQNQDEELRGESYEVDLNELPKLTQAGHGWRQQGPMLVCTTCPIAHSSYIGTNLQLTGIDDRGNPVFKKR